MYFQQTSFNKCLYNPMEEDFYYSSPQIMALGTQSYMAYVICMYDPGSPLRKEYADLTERKTVAAEIADLNIEDTTIDDLLPSIMGYLQLVKSRRWAAIIAIELTIWEMVEKLSKPIETVGSGADKDKLAAVNMKPDVAAKLVETNDLLDSELNKFYDGDIELKEAAEKKAIRIGPESIAAALKGKK